MIIIPAIDLIDGACVRLRQGSYADTTVYDENPVDMARRLVDAGAQRIHLVDLDAARGSGDNRSVIRDIRTAVSVELEVGGGVRDHDALQAVLDLGIDYAVVGTVLARDPELVAGWAARAGSRMIASIDARDGWVRVSGWQEDTALRAQDVARRAGTMGLSAVEYTNIARDGMLQGPDIAGTVAVARATEIPVILSGGIAETDDARRVQQLSENLVAGIIVGRALYEGRFDLAAAVAATTPE
ncbi:MAG TPA: 1-(5-phosphoribosyl)-5-[(5-phosphoribosylamino)methylideneamino]imidazole-4-carboxamide isomerase [Alkalispirochaeta sp.]|nr:1-(5-phosphoribosyl)-5-[(5-phosphoribosylamino)methylideneamino]imidazole-4-carboxamide isomerase [Alkalispirochaeta sp.]